MSIFVMLIGLGFCAHAAYYQTKAKFDTEFIVGLLFMVLAYVRDIWSKLKCGS